MARAIERELGAEGHGGASSASPGNGLRGGRRQVNLRMSVAMIAAVDEAAQSFGMTRSQWIISALRGRLWDREGKVVVSPIAKQAISAMINQVVRIGRNVDQAVHAMHSANLPGSGLDKNRIAGQLVEMRGDVREVVETNRRALLAELNVEEDYWCRSGRP